MTASRVAEGEGCVEGGEAETFWQHQNQQHDSDTHPFCCAAPQSSLKQKSPETKKCLMSFHTNIYCVLGAEQLPRHKESSLVFKEARLVNVSVTRAARRSIVAASFTISADVRGQSLTLNICRGLCQCIQQAAPYNRRTTIALGAGRG